MKLLWTERGALDRERIYSFIQQDNPAAALALDTLFEKRSKQLIRLPKLGRAGRISGTRELIVHPHYVLVYDISNDQIRVLRLLHTAQQWPPER